MGKVVQVSFSHKDGWDDLYPPVPASSMMPEWYKQQPNYLLDGKKIPSKFLPTPSTIKRCVPVFDALTSGYLILSSADVYVYQEDGHPFFRWMGDKTLSFHAREQAGFHPEAKEDTLPKWANKWVVSTPPGYSTMFIPPSHRESPFKILEGVVDTDSYTEAVEFPFVLTDPTWEGMIPAGTPIAQAIPFKRDSYQMKVTVLDQKRYHSTVRLLQSRFFDVYRKTFWNKKEYR